MALFVYCDKSALEMSIMIKNKRPVNCLRATFDTRRLISFIVFGVIRSIFMGVAAIGSKQHVNITVTAARGWEASLSIRATTNDNKNTINIAFIYEVVSIGMSFWPNHHVTRLYVVSTRILYQDRRARQHHQHFVFIIMPMAL